MEINKITELIIRCSIDVHRYLGQGLLESVYEEALCWELTKYNSNFQRQPLVSIKYNNINLSAGFRADLIVENAVIVEIKSVEKLLPLHGKQLLTFLRLTDLRVGLLINFNTYVLKQGIERVINGF